MGEGREGKARTRGKENRMERGRKILEKRKENRQIETRTDERRKGWNEEKRDGRKVKCEEAIE